MSFAVTNNLFLNKAVVKNSVLDSLIGCVVFVILTVVGAYIRVPLFFTPVPITLQTFFVVLSGAMLGKRWGMASQAAYLSLGIFGLPVFQGYGCGINHILGPTGGYLVGFMAASYVVGGLTKRDQNNLSLPRIFLAMAAGFFAIYIFGIIWLRVYLGLGLNEALLLGLYPFIPGDILKLIAAASLYRLLEKRS